VATETSVAIDLGTETGTDAAQDLPTTEAIGAAREM
jgi:hypothetical protein